MHCEGYDCKEFPDEFMEAPLCEPFFTRRNKMFRRPDGFMLFGTLGVDFFSSSELQYPNVKIRLRPIRAGRNFYMISDNANVDLAIVDFSFYTRIALKDDYHKIRMDMLHMRRGVSLFRNLSKDFDLSWQTKPVHPRKHFNNAPVRRIAIGMIQTLHLLDLTLKIHSGIIIRSQTN